MGNAAAGGTAEEDAEELKISLSFFASASLKPLKNEDMGARLGAIKYLVAKDLLFFSKFQGFLIFFGGREERGREREEGGGAPVGDAVHAQGAWDNPALC